MPKVQFEVQDSGKARLDKLAEKTEGGVGGVIANSIRLYEALTDLVEQGYTFQKVKDGKAENLELFKST